VFDPWQTISQIIANEPAVVVAETVTKKVPCPQLARTLVTVPAVVVADPNQMRLPHASEADGKVVAHDNWV